MLELRVVTDRPNGSTHDRRNGAWSSPRIRSRRSRARPASIESGATARSRPAAPWGTFETFYPARVNAPAAWTAGITGAGVAIAVVDTVTDSEIEGLGFDSQGSFRIAAFYDAIEDLTCDPILLQQGECPGDANGHGTHVSGVALNSRLTGTGDHAGVAPDAGLVIVRAIGAGSSGTYADVVRGIDWVVQNRVAHGIGVINLSISAQPQSWYWDDPINQAVMAAWQAGIVVVASAGNGGPDPMTVGVPANVPYVIAVGAISDAYTPADPGDDFLASFSAAGPTLEAFVKPELVAPGGHLISTMKKAAALSSTFTEYRSGSHYFQMSGTSQAAAVVSGVAAGPTHRLGDGGQVAILDRPPTQCSCDCNPG